MNFYFLIYKFIETSEGLESGMKYLASHALSASPRNGQANRALLKQCGHMVHVVNELLNSKFKISKIQLRRTAILFQILEKAHRRVLNLAGVPFSSDENSISVVWGLLCGARLDYNAIRNVLHERIGVPLNLDLSDEDGDRNFADILRKEFDFQEAILKLIEKGIEVFDEERELTDQLALIRIGLLEERKNLKRLLSKYYQEREKAVSLECPLDVVQT